MISSPPIPKTWNQLINRMRRLVNAGWIWFYFAKMLIGTAVFTSCLLWLLRVESHSTLPAWILGGGGLIVSILGAIYRSVPRRIGWMAALSRLDVGWHLDHRLVSASQGIGKWPPVPDRKRLPVRVRAQYIVPPLTGVTGLLLLALWLPLPPQKNPPEFNRVEPPTWTSLDSLADELKQQKLVEEESIHRLRNELEQLRKKPMQDWYDPSTLEATDRLRGRLRNDSERLMQAMNNTSALLNLAEQGGNQITTPQQEAMQKFLEQMQLQMGEGNLKLNQEMLQQLQQVDLSQLQQIDAQQLQELEQQLSQQMQAMEQALLASGIVQGTGGLPGSGGISSGGGSADLSLKDFESFAEPMIPMPLDPGNLDSARIGEKIGLRDTEHLDAREAVPANAGALRTSGGSGEVVWQQDVLPAEEKVLKDYFK